MDVAAQAVLVSNGVQESYRFGQTLAVGAAGADERAAKKATVRFETPPVNKRRSIGPVLQKTITYTINGRDQVKSSKISWRAEQDRHVAALFGLTEFSRYWFRRSSSSTTLQHLERVPNPFLRQMLAPRLSKTHP